MEGEESFFESEDNTLQNEEEDGIEDISVTQPNEPMQCEITPEKQEIGTPSVYQLVNDSFDDHFNELTSILTFHKPFQVEERLVEYLESKDTRLDWNAVWRCESPEVDTLVKVTRIHARKSMSASIEIQDCFDFADNSTDDLGQQLNEYLQCTHGKVLLLDLYPVCRDNDDHHLRELASAIEQLRFFYDYIWRVSDEEDCDDCVYVTRSLQPRLKLYYEMKMNPSSVDAKKYTEVIQEYQTVYREFVRKRLALSDDIDGSDLEMSEQDLLQIANVYECLARLAKTLSVMETPALRKLFACGGSNSGAYPSSEARSGRPDGSTVTHIVCNKLKAFMVQNLASDTEIMHHKSLDAALQSSFDGDDVMLYPGTYSSWGLSDMQQSISIKGVGEPGHVIIDTDDIPVEILSYEFVIDNIMFTCDSDCSSYPVLRVKRGTCELRNCMFQGGSVGILAHGQCSLNVRNCSIQGAGKAGLLINQGCSVELTDNTIVQCGSCEPGGVVHKSDTGAVVIYMNSTDEKTKLTFKNNKLIKNCGYDICLIASDARDHAKMITSQEFLDYPLLQVDLIQDNELKGQRIGVVGTQ